jgi:hypothetical protein
MQIDTIAPDSPRVTYFTCRTKKSPQIITKFGIWVLIKYARYTDKQRRLLPKGGKLLYAITTGIDQFIWGPIRGRQFKNQWARRSLSAEQA